jgi:bifunctional UDP-N-acetylglucosamine pyrophosphorylase/glucosamine-1-phosphate N-acetyltransferase
MGDAEIGVQANSAAPSRQTTTAPPKHRRGQRRRKIGSNTVLVAPVGVGGGAYTGASSGATTCRRDLAAVPARVHEGWVEERKARATEEGDD